MNKRDFPFIILIKKVQYILVPFCEPLYFLFCVMILFKFITYNEITE